MIAFLRARLDEDQERIIRLRQLAAEDDAWRDEDQNDELIGYTGPDPLREVEAKRRIVDLAVRDHAESETAADEYVHGRAMSLMDAVALLALPYDTHPEYREEWRP